MKRLVKVILILLVGLPTIQCVFAGPTKFKELCFEADSLCRRGHYKEAQAKIENYFAVLDGRQQNYVNAFHCLRINKIASTDKTDDGVSKNKNKKELFKEERLGIEMSKQDTMVVSDRGAISAKVDTVITTYYRTDTLYFTDNSHLVHPYGIKSWRMEKKTWRWTFNSIGVAAVGGSIGMGIMASRNYQLHAANGASMRREHQKYYKDYKLYSGLMGGCIALAVVAFSANVLYIQVGNDVRIAPGVWVDWQGNAQASLNIKF